MTNIATLVRSADLAMFDLDGTVLESMPTHNIAIEHFVEDDPLLNGLPHKEVIKRAIHSNAVRTAWEQHLSGIMPYEEAIRKYEEQFLEAEKRLPVKVYWGSKHVLEHLSEQGKHIAAVTGMAPRILACALGALQIHGINRAMFDVIVNDDGRPVKPNPEAYDRLIADLQPERRIRRAVMFGDTMTDAKFAAAVRKRGIATDFVYLYGTRPDRAIREQSTIAFPNMLSMYGAMMQGR